MKRDYDSRGRLVLEYVKIDDEDIFEGDRQTMEGFLEKLRCDTYKGFNLLFGNIFCHINNNNKNFLRVYQDRNWLERPDIRKRPMIPMQRQKAHGMSNGNVDEWSKVFRGRYEFFKLYIKKQNEAADLKLDQDSTKLKEFMEEYTEDLFSLMQNDQQETWSLVQRTDYPIFLEKIYSGRFVRNNFNNFATVSTQVLLIHKSGQCLISEQQYEHRQEMWRRYLQQFSICNVNPCRYTISNKVSIEFKVDIPQFKVEPGKSVKVIKADSQKREQNADDI